MVLDWKGTIPLHLKCPNCELYKNLSQQEWTYLSLKTPEPLDDYHICPKCKRVWRILRVHADELSNI
jgi:rubredoxin